MLDDYLTHYDDIARLTKMTSTYPSIVKYWSTELFNICKNLFEYENVPSTMNIDNLESDLILYGQVGVFKHDDEILNGKCTGFGTTHYLGYYKNFTWALVDCVGTATIGKDGIIIYNNKTHTGLWGKISMYANLLAHVDVSIIKALVNSRNNVAFAVKNSKVANSIKDYQNNAFKGVDGKIVDYDTFTDGLKVMDLATRNNISINDLYELRANLIEKFYNDLGINTMHFKRGNVIESEIASKHELLENAIDNMMSERENGIKKVNELFGTNITVSAKIDRNKNNIIDCLEKGATENAD